MKHVAYIHGLNATQSSFSFVVSKLPAHKHHLIEYHSYQNLSTSIDECVQQLFKEIPQKAKVSLVGHSLGGVIAAIIAADYPDRVENLVTISAPLMGSKAALTLRWMPGALPILNDIVPNGTIISRCGDLDLAVPTLSIISTGGHIPAGVEPNDSVVAIASQRGLRFGQKAEVHANHFEVLMHDETVGLIDKFLFGEQ